MKLHNFGKTVITAGLSLAFSISHAAYPERPIKIVTPFAAGSGPDTNAREAANELQKHLSVSVVIENKPGASGAIGNAVAAGAKPDGYTLLIGSTSTLSIQPYLYRKNSVDIQKDFIPVSLMGVMHTGLIASPGVNVRDVKDLVAQLKKNPEGFNFGTMGTGSYSHLSAEWFGMATDTKPVLIPYSTTAPFSDLMAGQVQFMFDALPAAIGGVQTGKLKLLAITGDQRHPSFPNVPTFSEMGIKDFEPLAWQGLLAPAGTPQKIVDKLGAAMEKLTDNKELSDKWEKLYGGKLIGSSPEEFKKFITEDNARWYNIIRHAGLELD
jgi:tripartite-type tricarboxylate transporter receptor subunit TctC